MSPTPGRPALLAVDRGGSKVDAALVTRGGRVLGAARVLDGGGVTDPTEEVLAPADAAIALACTHAGIDPDARPIAPLGVYCLSGADLPADDRRLLRAIHRRGWSEDDLLRNDSFAVLRAGTDRAWGVAVVCGFGTNCAGIAPDGRMYRIPAVGPVSGDWGGGWELGREALFHAIRAKDGRGGPTALSTVVPEHFGLRTPKQVLEALYFGRMPEERLQELTPALFSAASRGDEIARRVVDRQADEIASMANAAIRRLRMTKLDVDVVLGGGVFRNDFPQFFERLDAGVHAVAPAARLHTLVATPPLVGAALLGLDRLGGGAAATARVRAALTNDRLTADTRGGAA